MPRCLVVFAVAALALTASRAAAQTTSEQPQMLPPVVTRVDPFMAELTRNIADSATLASMNARDRYLRLQRDNRYLERVLAEQDERIEQLEKRLAALRADRDKVRSMPQETASETSKELERALIRAERSAP